MGAMTAVLPDAPTTPAGSTAPARRPLVLVATLGGVAAAVPVLLICMALGVIGWFMTDAGAHGEPRDALRAATYAWLLAHGGGLTLHGVTLTAMPLGLTLLCAWSSWRVAHRVGAMLSGHGPDSDRLADGERDLTVPAAVACFAFGYLVVATWAVWFASSAAAATDPRRVVVGVALIVLLAAAPALAIGSGRAPVWLRQAPHSMLAAAAVARATLRGFLAVATLVWTGALAASFGTTANIATQLGADAGDITLMSVLTLAVVPNISVFTGAYLLGPGFVLGAGTSVSPAGVVLGPLPMFPVLAALPEPGVPPAWHGWLLAVPALVAAVATFRALQHWPTHTWLTGIVRGGSGGLLAGGLLALVGLVAGGSIGPGRMQVVHIEVFATFVNALAAFGLAGVVGGLAATWWQRRHSSRSEQAEEAGSDQQTPDPEPA